MIGDAEQIEVGAMLDEVDRSAQDEAAVDEDRIGQAARIAPLVVQAEAELEVSRAATSGSSAIFCTQMPEVAPQLVDLVAPDAIDRRRERLGVFGGDAIERRRRASATAAGQRRARDRQRAVALHRR